MTANVWRATIAALLCVLAASAGAVVSTQEHTPDARPRVLEVFVRDGCPHCADAKAFLVDLVREDPTLAIVYREVDRDPLAREELVRVFDRAGMWPPGVPTFVVDGEMLVGFTDADTTGPAVRALVARTLPPSPTVETALFGTLSASRLGLPLFTLALGLLDGFNPCAMWVLLFLLSLLVRLHDRRRMALIAGTFVFVSGAVYYAFMAAWLNVFLAVGMSTAVRWTLGLVAIGIGAVNVKDFAAWGWGPSLSIPAAAKPGLYARARAVLNAEALTGSLLAVATLAVLVNVVELLCTAGLPAIYTAVLTQHDLSHAAHYAYLGLYIVGYVVDDAVMVVAAVAALGSHKLTERAGRWLKLVSGLVMLALGGVLLLRPAWVL
ncbi:MAG: glutaredoxin family protein [Dehalococcoidia bacterium]